MNLQYLATILPLLWLVTLVSSAPTGVADLTTPDSEAPVLEGESGQSSLATSAIPVEVQILNGDPVVSPRSDLDSAVEDEAQLAERGVTLVKRVDLFWYFVPNSVCWSCVVERSIALDVAERYLGRETNATPPWIRGLLPRHLVSRFGMALQQCLRLVPDACGALASYVDEFGFIVTIDQAAWIAYIVAPVVFGRPPPGPPPPKE
ncbi:hypothetical protein BDV96DRAFT_654116 [Lophiotrema nucula]|uniref:Uncharacterized protein n=1 Tax=Lophiotrema nucula TaxID=690887 RepID=A0A6A5YJW4_9PLEO|nr:hypothetical protein BDV96DRAFT_654116 [Lophiotrema nucula]